MGEAEGGEGGGGDEKGGEDIRIVDSGKRKRVE
jgi:hypothetical protein